MDNTSKIPLSVLIIAKNEEKKIVDCITSCSFAGDILVIDDESDDSTAELAKQNGARVIRKKMDKGFGEQVQFAIDNPKYSWCFVIDADERCSDELGCEIRQLVAKNELNAYWIRRRNFFGDREMKYGAMRPDYVLRIFPKEKTTCTGEVHQTINSDYPHQKLQHYIIHLTYQTWEQYSRKMNQYSTLAADKNISQGKKIFFFRDIVLRPIWAFLKVYIFNLGFLDGKLGYITSINHAHYTMMKYVKTYSQFNAE